VLCAFNGGSPAHPGWYHNLTATGRAEIQIGPQHLTVTARTADPTERRRLFPRFVEMYQGYGPARHPHPPWGLELYRHGELEQVHSSPRAELLPLGRHTRAVPWASIDGGG
jgi:F420H(2)-dependent quinone reductase